MRSERETTSCVGHFDMSLMLMISDSPIQTQERHHHDGGLSGRSPPLPDQGQYRQANEALDFLCFGGRLVLRLLVSFSSIDSSTVVVADAIAPVTV
jgi:hypothetical protein